MSMPPSVYLLRVSSVSPVVFRICAMIKNQKRPFTSRYEGSCKAWMVNAKPAS